MPLGAILAHKHTLVETYAGFFRALATESFAVVRQWLHPELEQLILNQCQQRGETAFLRSLKHGLGSSSQRLRLGPSQAQGAGQIRTQLVDEQGEQAGSVRFVLVPDGWRIYAVEVWTSSKPPMQHHAQSAVRQQAEASRSQATRVVRSDSTRQSGSDQDLSPLPRAKANYCSTKLDNRSSSSSDSGGVMKVTNWLRKMTFH